MLYLNKGYKSLYCVCHKICYCVQNAFSSQFSLPLFGISKPACPPWPLSHCAAQTHKLSHASHIWLVYNSDLIAGKPFMASPFQRMSLMLAFCCALGLLTMCMGGGGLGASSLWQELNVFTLALPLIFLMSSLSLGNRQQYHSLNLSVGLL